MLKQERPRIFGQGVSVTLGYERTPSLRAYHLSCPPAVLRQSPSVSACMAPGAKSGSCCMLLKLPICLYKRCGSKAVKPFVFSTCYGFEQTQRQPDYSNTYLCQSRVELMAPTKLLIRCVQNT